jgi:trk system potassium uptake protein TrkA
MKAIIVGCGRVGARLARQLEADGHQVTVVDERQSAFGRLGRGFKGQMIVGTGTDQAVLRHAGIESADCFVSVTAGDNRNLMSAQIAQRIFHVKRVITRVYDPIREEVYRGLGLETFCPTAMGADLIHTYFLEGVNTSRSATEAEPAGQRAAS